MSCSVAISTFLRHEVSFWVCGSAILSTGEYRAYRHGGVLISNILVRVLASASVQLMLPPRP